MLPPWAERSGETSRCAKECARRPFACWRQPEQTGSRLACRRRVGIVPRCGARAVRRQERARPGDVQRRLRPPGIDLGRPRRRRRAAAGGGHDQVVQPRASARVRRDVLPAVRRVPAGRRRRGTGRGHLRGGRRPHCNGARAECVRGSAKDAAVGFIALVRGLVDLERAGTLGSSGATIERRWSGSIDAFVNGWIAAAR